MLNHLCPCCGRHCYLDELQCERGTEYRETGVIPPRKPHPVHPERPDGAGTRKAPSEKKMQYLALDRDGRLLWNLRELGEAVTSSETSDACGLLSCLREEDRADLLMLLEKLMHSRHPKK